MAKTETLATGIIQVLVKGAELAQQQLAALPKMAEVVTAEVAKVTGAIPPVKPQMPTDEVEKYLAELAKVQAEQAKLTQQAEEFRKKLVDLPQPKPIEIKPPDIKPIEVQVKPIEIKPPEVKPIEVQVKPIEVKPPDIKPIEVQVKPIEIKPPEVKPIEVKAPEVKWPIAEVEKYTKALAQVEVKLEELAKKEAAYREQIRQTQAIPAKVAKQAQEIKAKQEDVSDRSKMWATGEQQKYLKGLALVEAKEEQVAKKENKYKAKALVDAKALLRQQELTAKFPAASFVLTGVDTAVRTLQGLQSKFQAIGSVANTIGNKAALGFAALSGAVLESVRSADPVGWQRLEIAIGKANIQIGRIFIPILRGLTQFIDSVATTFRNLTDPVREVVLNLVMVGLGLLAVVAVGGKLIALLPGLATLCTVAGNAFLFLWSAAGGPATIAIIAIVGVIAAIAAIGVALLMSSSRTKDFTNVFTKSWDKCVAAMMKLKEAWDAVVKFFDDNADEMIHTLSSLFDSLADSMSALFGGLGELLMDLAPLFKALVAVTYYWSKFTYSVLFEIIALAVKLQVWAWKIAAFPFVVIFMGIKMIWNVFASLWDSVRGLGDALKKAFDIVTLGAFKNELKSVNGEIQKMSLYDRSKQIAESEPVKAGTSTSLLSGGTGGGVGNLLGTFLLLRGQVENYRDLSAKKEKAEKDKDKKESDPSRFMGSVAIKPELSSISEAYRKVQTSQTEAPKDAITREQRDLQAASDKKLQMILDKFDEMVLMRAGLL